MARVVSKGVVPLKMVVWNPGLEPARPGTELALPVVSPLDDAAIAALPRPKAVRKLAFGSGLYLWLMPNGSRLWRLRYRVGDKQREFAIGAWGHGDGEYLIDAARDEAAKARTVLADGLDPVKARQLDRIELAGQQASARAAQAAKLVTFGTVAQEWADAMKRKWSPGHRQAQQRRLDGEILPVLRNAPLATVDAPKILALLKSIERRGAHETLAKVRVMIGQVFRFAVATSRASIDPTTALRGAFVKPHVVSRATIPLKEFPQLFTILAAVPSEANTRLAFAWTLATCCRMGEMRYATWGELDETEIELDDIRNDDKLIPKVRVSIHLWRVGRERMKMRKEFAQPLSPLAVAILERARELRTSDAPDALLFPGFSRDGALSENALLALVARAGYFRRLTPHGVARASFSSWAHESGFDPLAVELCLAHRPGGVLGIYNRSEYFAQRLAILTEWGARLVRDGLVLP